jgi:hypothetical protein
MGLFLVFRCNPSPRGTYRTYDRLAASVHMDVLHSHLLLALPTMAIERVEQGREAAGKLVHPLAQDEPLANIELVRLGRRSAGQANAAPEAVVWLRRVPGNQRAGRLPLLSQHRRVSQTKALPSSTPLALYAKSWKEA